MSDRARIYTDTELTILRAAEALLNECRERGNMRAWNGDPKTGDLLALGEIVGKADQARSAIQTLRIHHEVYFTPSDLEAVSEPRSLRA